jgi:hypothetical protein
VNPTPGSSEPLPDVIVGPTTNGVEAANLQTLGFKVNTATAGTWVFDSLRIGDAWVDVLPTVPEPSVLALGGVGAVAFGVVRRKRR